MKNSEKKVYPFVLVTVVGIETPLGLLNRGDLIQGICYKVLEKLEVEKAGSTVTQRSVAA